MITWETIYLEMYCSGKNCASSNHEKEMKNPNISIYALLNSHTLTQQVLENPNNR